MIYMAFYSYVYCDDYVIQLSNTLNNINLTGIKQIFKNYFKDNKNMRNYTYQLTIKN